MLNSTGRSRDACAFNMTARVKYGPLPARRNRLRDGDRRRFTDESVPHQEHRRHARRGPRRWPEKGAWPDRPDPDGHRRHRRHRHFRADRHRRADRRPGADGVVRHRRHRLRLCRAVLRRVRLDDPGRRLHLYLQLRHAGRTGRVDHRLGPAARIRAGHVGGVGRLVGLLPVADGGLRPGLAGRADRRAAARCRVSTRSSTCPRS